jgi:hypothetical protein
MGIPLHVFTLYALRGASAGCLHHLLLRVTQPEFSNADASDYDAAVDAAEAIRGALMRAYERNVLAHEWPGAHEATLLGEMQAYPVGDELTDAPSGHLVDIWVAQTRYGPPWVILGTAPSEAAFWRAVDGDEEWSSLGRSVSHRCATRISSPRASAAARCALDSPAHDRCLVPRSRARP